MLVLNLWLLGYHHVVATWTRLAGDRESMRRYRWEILLLPWLVLGGVWLVGQELGVAALGSVYLYWQWYHYTRQGYGLSRLYANRGGDQPARQDRLSLWVLYAVPLSGILWRSYQAPDLFLGLEVIYMPAPALLVVSSVVIATILLAAWLARAVMSWRVRSSARLHDLYVVSHVAVFVAGYWLVPSLDHGWLVINVWHNTQYLLIVWLYHCHSQQGRQAVAAPGIKRIARPGLQSIALYVLLCLGVSTVVYGALDQAVRTYLSSIPSAAILIYLVINFHHYLIDARIWRVRSDRLRRVMGLDSHSGVTSQAENVS